MHPSQDQVANRHLTRYTVQSSDVLSDMKLNVYEEGSESVMWYKERFLADEEIIEHIVENATSTIEWIIRRPVRGWYIRLSSPSFPPGSFISLQPPPTSSPYHSEAALTFACRTNAPATKRSSVASSSSGSRRSRDSDVTLNGDTTVHSYPPTPPPHPVVRISPPSPRAVHAKLAEIPLSQAPQQITPFLMTPHSNPHIPEQKQLSVFARMMSALKNSAPSHSSSFTLSPIPSTSTALQGAPAPTPVPLLTYHDRTPVWKVGSTHGLLEIDTEQAKELGVQTSFYVAVALTYLEFLTERESYLAAVTD